MRQMTSNLHLGEVGLAKSALGISIFFLISIFFSESALADECKFDRNQKLQDYCLQRNNAGFQRCTYAGGFAPECERQFNKLPHLWTIVNSAAINDHSECRRGHANDIEALKMCSIGLMGDQNPPIKFNYSCNFENDKGMQLHSYCTDRTNEDYKKCINAGGYGLQCAKDFLGSGYTWSRMKSSDVDEYNKCRTSHQGDLKEQAKCEEIVSSSFYNNPP